MSVAADACKPFCLSAIESFEYFASQGILWNPSAGVSALPSPAGSITGRAQLRRSLVEGQVFSLPVQQQCRVSKRVWPVGGVSWDCVFMERRGWSQMLCYCDSRADELMCPMNISDFPLCPFLHPTTRVWRLVCNLNNLNSCTPLSSRLLTSVNACSSLLAAGWNAPRHLWHLLQ